MVYWSFHGGSSTMTIYHHNSERSTYHLPYWIPILSPNWSGNPVYIYIFKYYTYNIHSGLSLRILLPVVGTCLIWDDQWNPFATVGTMGSPKRWFVATQLGHWSCFDCWIIRIFRSSTARLHGGDSSDQGKAYHVTSKDCAGERVPLGQRNTELHFSRTHGPRPGSDRQW